jgi:hypothetical protein
MKAHACDDRTDEVNVKDGVDVDQMEDHGRGQEAEARKSRHFLK